jgi:putative hydrolase of the HAD superfamily
MPPDAMPRDTAPHERTTASRRGLLVDYGGVLTTNIFSSFEVFCLDEGLAAAWVVETLRNEPVARELLIGLEIGALPEQDFEQGIAALIGVRPEGLIGRLLKRVTPDPVMVAAVRAARNAGVRTCLVSNSWGHDWYDRALFDGLFDGVVISGEVGLRKPSPEIYVMAVEKTGLAPAECVFVDDIPLNLAPALELGMAAVHHRDSATTVAELERLLGIVLTPAA